MNTKITEHKSKFDALRWIAIAVLIVAALITNSYYANEPFSLRLIGWLVLGCVVFVITMQTYHGRRLLNFSRAARTELRRVVWPTRQETVQTTLVVIVMVIVVGLLLWGIDGVLMWLISLLTGQRG